MCQAARKTPPVALTESPSHLCFCSLGFPGLLVGFVQSIVEKLLRSCQDIRQIYVLVRDKSGKEARERLAELTEAKVSLSFIVLMLAKDEPSNCG